MLLFSSLCSSTYNIIGKSPRGFIQPLSITPGQTDGFELFQTFVLTEGKGVGRSEWPPAVIMNPPPRFGIRWTLIASAVQALRLSSCGNQAKS
jgi:hypothetical protein